MCESARHMELTRQIHREMARNFWVNFLVNGGLVWLTMRGRNMVPPWGMQGYVCEVTLTGFLLPIILGGIFIAKYRSKRGNEHPVLERAEFKRLTYMPSSPWLAALGFGVAGVMVGVPILLVPISLAGFPEFSVSAYALIKGIWAAALAVVVVALAICIGLRRDLTVEEA